jgi:hypothetical protein
LLLAGWRIDGRFGWDKSRLTLKDDVRQMYQPVFVAVNEDGEDDPDDHDCFAHGHTSKFASPRKQKKTEEEKKGLGRRPKRDEL